MNRGYMMLNALITAIVIFEAGIHMVQSKTPSPTKGALLLTPLLEKETAKALNASRVHGIFGDVEAYSGYITVDEYYKSHLFFLHMKAPGPDNSLPLLLWLPGGPGLSGLRAQFLENGPLGIEAGGRLYRRNRTLLNQANIIYLDMPAGGGYSILESSYGYPKTLDDVAKSIEEFFRQFLQLFPEYRGRKFYVAGESYGARAAVGIVDRLSKSSQANMLKVSGAMLGVGFLPPILEVFDSSEFLHSVQMLDENGYKLFKKKFESIRSTAKLLFLGPSLAALKLSETIYDLFFELTGYNHQGNVLQREEPLKVASYELYVKRSSIKRALHVGDLAKLHGNMDALLQRLGPKDFFTNITSTVVDVMEKHPVLLYAGQMDTLIPATNIERFVKTLAWSQAAAFAKQKRLLWSTYDKPRDLAGYVTTTGNFSFAVVRSAGHFASMDATDEVYDLYARFICNDFESLRKSPLNTDGD